MRPPGSASTGRTSCPSARISPYLDRQRRVTPPYLCPPKASSSQCGGWTLHCASFPADRLPADWRSRATWRAYVDAAAITQPAHRALARDGLRPLGMGGRHKQLGDFFTDRKVPPALRKGWPIVVDAASGRIVWVCGLAVAHEARITGGTRNTCAALIGAATLAWTHQRPAHLFQKRNPSIAPMAKP